MLAYEKVNACNIGYDRPSPKLMGFLRKHYKLTDYLPQNNNYVVFKDYFLFKPYKPIEIKEIPKETLPEIQKHIEEAKAEPIKIEAPLSYEHIIKEKPNNNAFASIQNMVPRIEKSIMKPYAANSYIQDKIDQNKRELEATAEALRKLEMDAPKLSWTSYSSIQRPPWGTFLSLQDKCKMTSAADIGFFLNQSQQSHHDQAHPQ